MAHFFKKNWLWSIVKGYATAARAFASNSNLGLESSHLQFYRKFTYYQMGGQNKKNDIGPWRNCR